MKVTRLLAFRLFAIILIVLALGTAIFTTFNVSWQSERFMASMVRSASRMSDVIKRSARYSMLLNRRVDVHQIISTIGNEPDIEAIRIYNKLGTVTFSSDSSEVGINVNTKAEACSACHSPGKQPVSPNPNELTRIFPSPKGYRVLGMITPIYNEPICSSGDCHAHSPSQTVLGVLDVQLPLKEFDATLAESTKAHYANGAFLVLAVAVVAGVFIWMVVNVPVRELTRGTEEIMRGNLRHRIPVRTRDEIGTLAGSFNKMTDELNRARNEITEWTQTLEQRVDQKTDELRRAQKHLIQVEKMASLGKLAATVAHELNNPLEGVLTYARLLKRRIRAGEISSDSEKEIHGELALIADETARCGTIVKNLLLFSRQKVVELQEEDIRVIVQRSLKLIEHHLQMHNIILETRLGEQPLIVQCNPQQLEQALLALEINAVESMAGGGSLTIDLTSQEESARIRISDTGVGIAEEDLPHIFEPFFTTKVDEKGTGLGLAIVYGIIQQHEGTIDVLSHPGLGTTFTISLPLRTAVPAQSST